MMTAVLMEIFWDLAALMARKKITVNQLAETLEISRSTASRLKNSDTMPGGIDHDRLLKICTLLECTPGDLFRTEPDND